MAWNNVEGMMRLLLYKAAGGAGNRVDVLIANLGTVAIGQSLIAISATWEEPLRSHIKHSGDLFNAARLYRNHYVHDAIMLSGSGDDDKLIALTQHSKIVGGALKLHQGQIAQEQLDVFNKSIAALRNYASDIIIFLYRMPGDEKVAAVKKPSLPHKLELRRLNVIEAQRGSS